MRGPMMMLALGALLAGCNGDEPAPAPEPTPTPVATEDGAEQASIIRPEMEVERPPIALEPLRATIPFGDGGSDLSEMALAELNAMLETDQWQQVERVILRGHSDAGGPDRVNMRVSEERAQAVADWLMEQGLDEEAIRVIPFGAQNPVQPNLLPNGEPNERGRAANRRVEVTLLVPEGATIPDPGPTVTPEPEGPPSSPASGAPPKPRATGGSITQ
ncbi:OmpA family protein [Citromicrobium sp. JLT1363]|uniref:OmpA family protein n=1 Tax=Citromicrobium sp. JLT1363 TaxID=517722 RepID=UPI000225E2AC|nr:OmpA family protein [Citromicrobium sp. JLT1363]